MNSICSALEVLRPGSVWAVRGLPPNEVIEWRDTEQTQPTEEEIVQKIAELEYQEEVEAYKEQRAAEYPSYPDQFDQIFHAGIDAWKATILEVKKKYPKQVMQSEVLEERKRKALSELRNLRTS